MTDPLPLLNYHIDHPRKIVWIIHRKLAGASIREALGCRQMVDRETAFRAPEAYKTITCVRHPWDRLTSAAYHPYNATPDTIRGIIDMEVVFQADPRYMDWHFLPQWIPLKGFRVDYWLVFEHLDESWKRLQKEYPDLPDLEHRNQHGPHDWREQPVEWHKLLRWYAPDFDFNSEWERE